MELYTIAGVINMDPDFITGEERLLTSFEDLELPTDTLEHHNTLSKFEESVNSAKMAYFVTEQRGNGPGALETSKHLDCKVQNLTFDNHFTTLYNEGLTRNCFSWLLIHIALGFFYIRGLEDRQFPHDSDYDFLLAIFEIFNPEVPNMVEDQFFLSFYHFVVYRYGHVPIDQTYAPRHRSDRRKSYNCPTERCQH